MRDHEKRVEQIRTQFPGFGAAYDAMKAERDAWKARAAEHHAHRARGTKPKCRDYIAKVEAERDAAVKRAEEAEDEVVNGHQYGEDNPDGCWVHPQGEDRKTIPGACPICRRVLGKGEE